MNHKNYFPTHLALGYAFCNRKDELKRLTANVQGSNPILIMSPRRYGKTSLAINTFNQLKIPYVHIDFYKELCEEDIEIAILNGIGVLIKQLETVQTRFLKLVSDFFTDMNVSVVLEKAGVKLDFSKRQKKIATSLCQALDKLHALAVKKKKKVILFMDEFQVLGEVTDNHAIEAAIREMAQKSTHVVYVFSGSSRHLIQEMFCDKKRPFYKFCDIIFLERISQEDYSTFIQKASLEKWKKKLSKSTLQSILDITERHPHYVNKLCSLLWLHGHPNEKAVVEHWKNHILEQRSFIEREIELLSLNQRKILIFLANHGPIKEFFAQKVTAQLNMPMSSISTALSVLTEKDYVHVDEDGFYRILDPLLKNVLQRTFLSI